MSHFTTVKTEWRDQTALVAALNDLGYAKVEVHDVPKPLYGYKGDVRPQVANVIIRRHQISSVSNDIGFLRGADGVFEAIISKYDSGKHNQAWLGKLKARYGINVIKAVQEARGYKVIEETTRENGETRLLLEVA